MLGGFSAAFVLFIALHALSGSGVPARTAAAMAVACVLVGWTLGRRIGGSLRSRSRRVAAPILAVLWIGWAFVQPGGAVVAPILLLFSSALLGFAALETPTLTYFLSLAAGFAVCSLQVPALMGVGTLSIVAGLLLVAALVLRPPHRNTSRSGAPAGAVLLAAACGAAAVGLLRAYVVAARSLPYAGSDVGAAFVLGAVVASLAARKRVGEGFLLTRLTAVVMICLVAARSWWGFPDAIVSETAALQAPARLLTISRTFPMLALAFALGCAFGPFLCKVRLLVPVAAASGALLAAALSGFYRGPHVLAMATALAGMLSVCPARVCIRERAVGRGLAMAASVIALMLLALVDPHRGWIGLRTAAAFGGAGSASVQVERAALDGRGLRASLVTGEMRSYFVNGNLTAMSRSGKPAGGAPALTTTILGLAFAGPTGPVYVVGRPGYLCPQALATLAPDSELSASPAPPADGGKKARLVLCGPETLSDVTGGAVLTRESLSTLKAGLSRDGALALYLPAGQMSLDELRRSLATVAAVFGDVALFLWERDAVVIAGDRLSADYGRLAAIFDRTGSSDLLADADLWDPADLMMGYAAGDEQVREVADGASPFRSSGPERPVRLSRDLSGPSLGASRAALLQYRLLGAGGLLALLEFDSQNQKTMALRGIPEQYAARTSRLLGELGRLDTPGRRDLIAFLQSPYMRADLLAGGETEPNIRAALAMARFGLREAAAEVLRNAIEAGQDGFRTQSGLASILEDLDQPQKALVHYRAALSFEPDSVPTLQKVAALQLVLRRFGEAARTLESLVEQRPEDKTVLLLLGNLYAARLQEPRKAGNIAQRILEIDPANADALELLLMSRRALEADDL